MADLTDHFTSVSIGFQYKSPTSSRPDDCTQMENLSFKVPYGTPIATVPIPAVGDTVYLRVEDPDRPGAYKVLTRHFSYTEVAGALLVAINIVVTDVEPGEMAARLKE